MRMATNGQRMFAWTGARGRTYAVTASMDWARGLAALWVFLFHIADTVKESFPLLYPIAEHGHLGVPVFFAISGYCIFAAAQKCVAQGGNSKGFLHRRLVRIFPTYWASILVVLLLPYLLESLSLLKTGTMRWPSPKWLDYMMGDWIGIVTLTKGLVDGMRGNGTGYTLINSVYWTLAIEVQFYLVLFVALWLRKYWVVVLGLVSLVSLAVLFNGTTAFEGFFLPFWPAFLSGVVLRLAYSNGLHPLRVFGKHQLAGAIGVLAVLIGGLVLLTHCSRWLTFMEAAGSTAIAMWALGGLENGWRAGPAQFSPLCRKVAAFLAPGALLGQFSYSIYLLHGKVYQLPSMVVRQFIPTASPLNLLFVVLGTVSLCYVFYCVVERRYLTNAVRPEGKPIAGGGPSLGM